MTMMLSVSEYDIQLDPMGNGYLLLDRGDEVAQEVLDRNARSQAQRLADETREELARVMRRVDNIYGTFDAQDTMYNNNTNTNLEYVGSTDELEKMLNDPAKKHKYQQQVTVFIVGYQSTCTQKFRLLQQVNDFFIDNTNNFEPEEDSEPPEEIDLDAIGSSIEESLEYAQSLAERLGQINHGICEFAAQHTGGKGNKGRKKLEKALNSAREDITSLNDKLVRAQLALEEKEEKIQGLFKTVELRTSESQRFRTAAEAAKKSVQEADRLRVELAKQEEKLSSLTAHLEKLETEQDETAKTKDDELVKFAEAGSQAETKMTAMREEIEHQQNHFDRLTSDLANQKSDSSSNLLKADTSSKQQSTVSDSELSSSSRKWTEEREISSLSNPQKRPPTESESADSSGTQIRETYEEAFLAKVTSAKLNRRPSRSRPNTRGSSRKSSSDKNKRRSAKRKDSGKKSESKSSDSESGSSTLEDEPKKTPEINLLTKLKQKTSTESLSENSSTYFKPRSARKARAESTDRALSATPSQEKNDASPDSIEREDLMKEHDRYVRKLKDDMDKQFLDMQEKLTLEKLDMQDRIEELTRKLAFAKQNVSEVEEEIKREKTVVGLSSTSVTTGSKKSRSTAGSKKQMSNMSKKEQTAAREYSDVGIQYSATSRNASPSPTRPVSAVVDDFQDTIDIDADEELWEDLPKGHVTGRFRQYREMSRARIAELEKEINDLLEKMQRKVMTLKAQYSAHKGRWESERKQLVAQIEEALKLQTSAESDTDQIMETLEKFVDEQEKIETPSRLRSAPAASSDENNITDDDKVKMTEDETEETEETTDDTTADDRKYQREKSSHLLSAELSLPEEEDEDDFSALRSFLLETIMKNVHFLGNSKNLTPPQRRALDILQNSLKSTLGIESLSDEQHLRSLNVYSMATQLIMESVQLGLDPSSIFRSLAKLGTRILFDEHTGRYDAMLVLPKVEGDERPVSVKFEERLPFLPLEGEMGEQEYFKPSTSGSARSRASARSKAKEAMEEKRVSIQDRRSNTPARSQKSAKSVLSEMSLDEDGDLPIPSDGNDGAGAPATEQDEPMEREDSLDLVKVPSTADAKLSSDESRHSYTIADHPVVQEFLKVYGMVVDFKDKVASARGDVRAELMSLTNIEFNKNSRVQSQLETMTEQLSDILKVIIRLLASKKGKESSGRDSAVSLEAGQISVLQQQISRLEQIIQDSTDKYESELNQNRGLLTRLEEKNAKLKRELSVLGRVVDDDTPQKMVTDSEVPIMFTRLDMERNGKIMKRAVYTDKLEKDKYKGALETMDSYVSIPARRFVHLVRKYVHHRQMREIEENVKKSHSLNDNVFNILDKMESLQNVRAQRWADYMDGLSSERVNLAQLLMRTLDDIEQESGIFLIKPIYSLKGRDPVSSIYSKYGHASANRRRTPPVLKQRNPDIAPRPEPPPRSPSKMGYSVQTMGGSVEPPQSARQENYASVLDKNSVWVAPLSEAHRRKFDDSQTAAMLNTPRILELDINRMLISQNAISAKIDLNDPLRTDGGLRSYVTINRPQATQLSQDRSQMTVTPTRLSFERGSSKLPPI